MKTRSFNLIIILALLLSLLGSVLTVTPARATSFTAGTAAELISAINNVNAIVDTDLDTITLTADISLTDVDNTTISGPNGLPVILASGGNLTIEGDGFTLSRAGGAPAFRFFENEGNLTLNNIILLNGSSPSSGGAIFSAGTLTLTNSTLSNNTASTNGGGIFNTGTLTVTNSTFTNNSVSGTSSAGGAIQSVGNLTVSSSTFDGNTASATGGIGEAGLGGAISVGNGQLTVSNSTFYANQAFGGNCAVTCTESGTGGVDIRGGSGHSIVNSTFSNNTFTPGTNGSITGYTAGALFTTVTLNLSNTILANSLGTDCSDFNNAVSGSNNLIESDGSLPFACGGVAVTSDPQLDSLTNNGGPTQTMALPTGSPAIDAGDATTCSNAPVSGLDQRGVTRPLGTCDIGAFELDTFTSTFTSQAVQDGRLLESSETSDAGGWLDSTALTFIVGDDNLDRQYRSILHFDTSSLPDNAVITKAVLAIKRQGITGSDPFLSLGLLQVDMRKPDFGAPSLELLDFNAAPAKTNVGTFSSSLSISWHRAILNNPAKRHINLLRSTQFRLSFTLDDNDNNSADFIRFYSGDSHTGSSPAASRPKLIITYTLP